MYLVIGDKFVRIKNLKESYYFKAYSRVYLEIALIDNSFYNLCKISIFSLNFLKIILKIFLFKI